MDWMDVVHSLARRKILAVRDGHSKKVLVCMTLEDVYELYTVREII